MNRTHLIPLIAGALTAFASPVFAGPNSIDALKKAAIDIPKEKDQLGVQSALVGFQNVAQMVAYFDGCYGVAVFPTIAKGGMGVGGAHGTGWVFRQGVYTGEVKMNQLTVGFQAGGQAFSQIIFFEDEPTYLKFTSGNFEFGAQASAVVIAAGANASASTAGGSTAGLGSAQTKLDYTGGTAVFTVAKGGLMYEAALGGQKFNFRPAGTESVTSAPAASDGPNSIAALKTAAADIPKEKDQLGVQSALVEFQKVPQMLAYFDGCHGVAIFPTIAKGGLGLGGAHGTGWVFRQGDYTGEVKMNQVTVGFQAGGQAFSQVIFFENEPTYRKFTSGEFEFGAQASAVVIAAGANASASTAGGSNAGIGSAQAKLDYTGGMAVFTVAKGGLMYEAALGGQKFSFSPAK